MVDNNKVALITGGGTGIGRATALELARRGCERVAITYSVSSGDSHQTCEELRTLGVDALAIQADVRKEAEVRSMVAKVIQRFDRLDMLINNAGTTRYVPLRNLDALTDEVWNLTFDTNLRGTFYCCRAASAHLKKTEGTIVNVASIAGIRGAGSSIAYSVSKAGVIHMTKMLAIALAPEIRVNCVAPGFVQTRWMEVAAGVEASRQEADRVARDTPLERVAMPVDVAEVIANLLYSRLVTGQEIVIDGGKSLKYD